MRHYRLRWAEAIEAHERALTRGGVAGFINAGLVDAAITRPYTGYYRSIRKKAAALTVILLLLLLNHSGYELVPVNGEDLEKAIEDMTVAVSAHQMTFADIEEWMRARIQKKPAN